MFQDISLIAFYLIERLTLFYFEPLENVTVRGVPFFNFEKTSFLALY